MTDGATLGDSGEGDNIGTISGSTNGAIGDLIGVMVTSTVAIPVLDLCHHHSKIYVIQGNLFFNKSDYHKRQ
jgi:hypothetical protein